MKNKKKLITALSMFALVVVVAAASVGITLAALSGTVTSTFNVTYQANNVEAECTAKYTLEGNESGLNGKVLTAMQSSENNKIEFKATDPSASGAFDAVNGTITDPDNWIYIAFTFTNKSSTADLNVTLTYNKGSDINFTVESVWDDSDSEVPSQGFTALDGEQSAEKLTKGGTTARTLWVRAHITNDYQGATFAGNFNFALANAAVAA